MELNTGDTSLILGADPRLRFERYYSEIQTAISQCISRGHYILGESVEQFEMDFAAYTNAEYCIAVNSGTDALTLSLLSLGLERGDEVITTSMTVPATIVAILNAGLRPCIVDVKEPTYCISTTAIRSAITKRSKVILPVHLHGYSADMQEILDIAGQYDLIVIEDCAQAHGGTNQAKKLGSFGLAGAFSFYPTKNLGCLGDAGAIVTSDPEMAESLRSLRNYGLDRKGRLQNFGRNSRMDEIQAAILNVLLPHLDEVNGERTRYVEKYISTFSEINVATGPLVEGAVYHQFPLRLPNRNQFISELRKRNISLGIHYAKSIRDFKQLARYCHNTPVAENVAQQFVSLPIQPEILDCHFDYILDSILACLTNQ